MIRYAVVIAGIASGRLRRHEDGTGNDFGNASRVAGQEPSRSMGY